jgi:acetyl-CoA carboxylase alpha subunit
MSRRRQCWRLLQQASQRIIDLTYDFDEDVNNILSSLSEVQARSGGDDVADFKDSLNEIMDIANRYEIPVYVIIDTQNPAISFESEDSQIKLGIATTKNNTAQPSTESWVKPEAFNLP